MSITRADVEGFAEYCKGRFGLGDDIEFEYRVKDGVLTYANVDVGYTGDEPSVYLRIEYLWDERYKGLVTVTVGDRSEDVYEGYGAVLEAGALLDAVDKGFASMGVFPKE